MEVGFSIGKGKLVMLLPIAIRWTCPTKPSIQTMLCVTLLLECSHSTLDFVNS